MADHHVRHLLCICLLCRHIADKAAAAQHGHAVRQALNLMHFMGNDNDRLAVVSHISQNCEQLLRLLWRQYRSRLVQNQDVGSPVQHLDDLDGLFL